RLVERDKGEFGGGHLDPPAAALAQYPDLDAQRHRAAPDPDHIGIAAHDVADLDRLQERDVADRGGDDPALGARVAVIAPAESISDISQPPKMSPDGLVSAGIAKVRAANSPRGWAGPRKSISRS